MRGMKGEPMGIKVGICAVVLMCTSLAWGEEIRWVSSAGTTLKAEASATSENVAELPVGAEVTVVETGGRWLMVRSAAGVNGWVYAGRLAETKPVAEVTGSDDPLFGDSMKKSQITTAKADSARSIRGLSPETAAYAKSRGTSELSKKSLEKIMGRKVSPTELKSFLKEGKLGEYAQMTGGNQ